MAKKSRRGEKRIHRKMKRTRIQKRVRKFEKERWGGGTGEKKGTARSKVRVKVEGDKRHEAV